VLFEGLVDEQGGEAARARARASFMEQERLPPAPAALPARLSACDARACMLRLTCDRALRAS